MQIYFRYSGSSRHDRGGANTPRLGASSLLLSLHQLPTSQRRATAVSVLLNGGAATGSVTRWFEAQLRRVQSLRAAEVCACSHAPPSLRCLPPCRFRLANRPE